VLLLNHTCPTPEENLALDEALLDVAERSGEPREVLRLWEAPRPLAVVGRSSRVAAEINEAACRARDVPILRRSSGGAAVIAGPGCLMYALVLSYRLRPAMRLLDAAHRTVMETMVAALRPLVPAVEWQGTCDLTIGGRKFSGNSMRCRREHLLYHGTLLYDFPLELIGECLGTPPRQPEYRDHRPHTAFVTNVPVSAERLGAALIDAWQAVAPYGPLPTDLVQELVEQKYSRAEWTYKH
jgi:lipoate-protein ligase A